MGTMATMIIHFTDGTKVAFRYPKITDATTLATKIRKGLEQDKIVVDTFDGLIIIPVSNIKYIQVSPSPEILPDGVIRDAEIIS